MKNEEDITNRSIEEYVSVTIKHGEKYTRTKSEMKYPCLAY